MGGDEALFFWEVGEVAEGAGEGKLAGEGVGFEVDFLDDAGGAEGEVGALAL